MPTPPKLTRAYLKKITYDASGSYTESNELVPVQFNPTTLTVTYGRGGLKQTGAQQTPGPGSSMSLDLYFDVTALPPSQLSGADGQGVQALTRKIVGFYEQYDDPQDELFAQTGVQFVWGKFLFVGVITSLSETMEYFAADGTPLRSKLSLTVTTPSIRQV